MPFLINLNEKKRKKEIRTSTNIFFFMAQNEYYCVRACLTCAFFFPFFFVFVCINKFVLLRLVTFLLCFFW